MTMVIAGQPIPAMRVTGRTLWKGKAYADYKEMLAWEMRRRGIPKRWDASKDMVIKRVAFFREGRRRADIDNLLKGVMEALAAAGFVDNDRQVVGIERMSVEHGSLNPRVEIDL